MSNIWWDETWNPVTGCSPISPGCENCWAARMAKRQAGRNGYPPGDGFSVALHPDKLQVPLHWQKPRRVFVCDMGDLLHPDVPRQAIWQILDVVAQCDHHTFMVLTKRPERLAQEYADYIAYRGNLGPLPNLWLGVTAENQAEWDHRVPILQQIPAALRFVSCEPLLGRIACDNLDGIGWVIAGGETGPGARECRREDTRILFWKCGLIGVPFFFKHRGGNEPASTDEAVAKCQEIPKEVKTT